MKSKDDKNNKKQITLEGYSPKEWISCNFEKMPNNFKRNLIFTNSINSYGEQELLEEIFYYMPHARLLKS